MWLILLQSVFWFSALVLLYTFYGYAALMRVLAKIRPKPLSVDANYTPKISIIIAAHNEEARAQNRLRNLLESEYPGHLLEIIVALDGCSDATASSIQAFSPDIRLIESPQRIGKAESLNRAAAIAQGEILVFADMRQHFAPDAIGHLVKALSDQSVAAVSGCLDIGPAQTSTGKGIDSYWKHEKTLRESEARFDSSIGCTGAIYAIRKTLFTPIPPDTILDDVVIPMQAAIRGYRVSFEAKAHAYDPQPLDPDREKNRKRRTLAGNYQMLFRYPIWLFPRRNRLWWQLISHKYLRLLAPFFLFGLLVSSLTLSWIPIYGAAAIAQLLVYFSAACQSQIGCHSALLSIPSAFVFLNLMSLRGLWDFISGKNRTGWR